MHTLIINFNLQDIDRDQYEEVCAQLAPIFAGVPGLLSKNWLANEETNTYGGVYVFQDRQAMLDYKASEIFAQIGANPSLVNVVVADFETLAGPSKVTGLG